MAKKDKTENPLALGRHVGERICGYEVFEDGTIRLAPMIVDRMKKLLDRTQGVQQMQAAIARYVADEMTALATDRREFWDTIRADLGETFASGSGWSISVERGLLVPPKTDPK